MVVHDLHAVGVAVLPDEADAPLVVDANAMLPRPVALQRLEPVAGRHAQRIEPRDRKSTRLNSSHTVTSYAVFCLKKKKTSFYSLSHKRTRWCDRFTTVWSTML